MSSSKFRVPSSKGQSPGAETSARKRPALKKGTLIRIVKSVFKAFPVLYPLMIVCIIFTAVVSSIPSLFLQNVIASIGKWVSSGDWQSAKAEIMPMVVLLGSLYLVSIVSACAYQQMGAYITQGYLDKMRRAMFNKMQNLPIRYFDTNKKGDIMSHYTNDIDTLRQLVSQAIPAFLNSFIVIVVVFGIMCWFCGWLTILIVLGIVLMVFAVKKFAGGSAKYFIRRQKSTGAVEGYIQEMMNGQKVIKVFNHERQTKEGFDRLNEDLMADSFKADTYASIMGPVNQNIGNILYVLVALVGGLLLVFKVPNFSVSGMAMSVSIVVPFLNMTKQFTGNINNVSQQFNAIVMALAGADRIFEMMDSDVEVDDGYVTLVNAKEDENGNFTETDERTGKWAWKHPHKETGDITYTPLRGDVRMFNVDFGYTPDKPVLYDVTLYAEPGQKVAFVGATGAGKTTITNLINRFYDIADGKIRIDGINVNKIKKADLRRCLGLVLQETSLFTGTVMENIRYGRLEATDEECIQAAKLAGADDFITRLPQGYNTELRAGGTNLSQGQRQLLAIARCAVKDPPVMILDEATSSIDTHTEAIVNRGMDSLMNGRTTFVIAHRLSTVKNSDVIMVLDHGRIIERGSHDELIAKRGTYYSLYTGAFELE